MAEQPRRKNRTHAVRKRTPVGVIGLGIMGSAIASNLLKAGFPVIGTDIIAERRAPLLEAGGVACEGTGEIGRRCRHIVVSLPSEAALCSVCDELREGCSEGAIVIETSTLPLLAKQKARNRLAARGVILLDCTLSGTGGQAKERDLAVYASGDSQAIKEVRPILAGFARVCYDLGEFGNGMKMKLIANLLVAIHNVAAAEAILLGARLGLDLATVVKVAADGAGGSRMLQMRGPVMANRTWNQPMMKNSVWQKDLALISQALQAAGSAAPLFSATLPIYAAAMNSGHAEHDTAAVYEVLESMARKAHSGAGKEQ